MGKARRTRQGIMIRFDAHDAELEQWLGGFAQSQSMTKVVKLACYLLAGLEPPPHLQALLPYVQPPRAPSARRVAPPSGSEVPGDALASVMQELAALRALMAEQGAGRPHAERTRAPGLADDAGLVESGGLDMSARRRRGPVRPAREGGRVLPPPDPVPVDGASNAQALIASIRAYCDEFQRGR
jgi:hypothetical protein